MPTDNNKQTYDHKQLEVLIRLCEIAWTNFDRRRSYEWKLSLAIWTALTAFIALTLRGKLSPPQELTFGLFAGLIICLQIFFLYRVKLANSADQKAALSCEKQLFKVMGEPADWSNIKDAREKARKFWKGYWSFVVHIGITLALILAAAYVTFDNINVGGEKSMSSSTSVFNVLIPLFVALVAFGGGLITWCLNERSKRTYEEYKRKEQKYSGLIKSLRGFYVSSQNTELKTEFINQLNLCWMYCPDEVIRKAYNFLFMVHTGQIHTDPEKEKALADLILAIRKDLISRKPLKTTDLKTKDFKHLKST